jgi:hypothetical protein
MGYHIYMRTLELKPKYLQAAEDEAAQTGTTAEVVLQEDLARLAQSTYPTTECLEPNELDALLNQTLAADRIAHLRDCAICRTAAALSGQSPVA